MLRKHNYLLLFVSLSFILGVSLFAHNVLASVPGYGCTYNQGCMISPLFDTSSDASPSPADQSITFHPFGITGQFMDFCHNDVGNGGRGYTTAIYTIANNQIVITDSDIPSLIGQTIGISYSGGAYGSCPTAQDLSYVGSWSRGSSYNFEGFGTFDSSVFPNGDHWIKVTVTDADLPDLNNTIPIPFTISHPATCTDPTANNNGQAGACAYSYGCTDPAATNYNPSAGVDDGSCTYPPATGTVCIQSNVTTHVNTSGGVGYSDDITGGAGYTCHGNASLDTYTANGSSLGGYTGPTYNTNPQTISSDGQTIYFNLSYTTTSVPGCTDPSASNYNPSANLDDGSCVYVCSGSPPTQSCTSGANSCGQTNNGTQTQTCNTSNYTWTGGWTTCTATPPPTPTPTTCTSTPNECGQTADATATCGNTCSAVTPANSCVPGVTISASPNPVSYNGRSTVSWTCDNASAGSVPGIGSGTSGSGLTPALTSNTTYTATCTGFNGTNPTASVTVNISGPSCNIDANGTAGPITVAYGSNPTINWACSNSGSGTVTPPNWTGVTGSQHTGSLTIPGTYVYTATCSGNGTASCNEFVTALPPVPVAGPGAPTYSPPDYCSSGPGGYIVWEYSDPAGSPQTAYEIQITDIGNFNNPFYDSGKLNASSHVFSIPNSVLQFGLGYKSRVRVWNSYDVASSWSDPTQTFNTPNYAYPDVFPPYQFTWPTVPKPQQSKPLQFTDHAVFGGGNSNQHSWSWDFGDGGTSTAQNPAHTYTGIGNYTITQTATDAANQTCSYAQSLNVQKPVPIIKEVAPR